jgi:hypothetical protein
LNSAQVGSILRMIGPLIQIGLIVLLVRRDAPATILGVPAERVVWGGFGLGLAITVVGIVLSRRRPPARTDPIDRPLNL